MQSYQTQVRQAPGPLERLELHRALGPEKKATPHEKGEPHGEKASKKTRPHPRWQAQTGHDGNPEDPTVKEGKDAGVDRGQWQRAGGRRWTASLKACLPLPSLPSLRRVSLQSNDSSLCLSSGIHCPYYYQYSAHIYYAQLQGIVRQLTPSFISQGCGPLRLDHTLKFLI